MGNVAQSIAPASHEFELTDKVFGRIRELVRQRAGIALNESKRSLVYGRLVRRIRALKLDGFASYVSLIEDERHEESQSFLNSLTTNVTEFFREHYHFEYMTEQLFPELQRRAGKSRKIRLWSAGCSTGEEPYSLAMTLLDAGLCPPQWDAKVLATDLDSDVLRHAARGVYADERLGKLPDSFRRKYLLRGRGEQHGRVRVKPEVTKLVSFRQLNLMGQWPMRGPFQAVFCRNVLIYFDPPTCNTLIRRFTELLDGNGRLFLGHSESLIGNNAPGLEPCGKTTYRNARRQP